ncbi:barstar family protein [Streptomyces sp. N2-109]|uniref:Barstar family protein n=1 Tax=Streptomyces gossypii TaxID=2883101 RepID=A0ABT2K5Q7_9ACTN|nr:barstar family protein [Streptomyces gossypii]MCT2594835.1 barstar family protein [Streptomyces gossypii]
MTSSVELPELPEDGLNGIFEGTVPPGVYLVPSVGPEALLQADAEGWQAAVLDLGGVTGRDGFFDSCVAGFELPEWFERNWDTLTDCLTDLSWWGETRGYLVLTSGWPDFARAAPRDADTAAAILAAAVGYWAVRETPLAVLLG